MLTPAQIQAIADPIEEVYIHITDELLVNIGKHLRSPTWTHTAAWEIQKLSEMGQLTAENAAIINKWIKSIPQEQREAMETTRRLALERIEKEMAKAAKEGWTPPDLSEMTTQNLTELWEQASDDLNLVNTTMLQSSLQQYQRAVQLTEEEYKKLLAQNDATLGILNDAAASVTTGVETRNVALRRALTRISQEGITGFYDRAGHRWSPEAYVNMDIRTTVHNTAIQAVKDRMEGWGTQVFQVSSHAGARPGCYPYQGKFYSWDNTEGDIELGDGSMVHYMPLNTTTHGQPAGLFGINCGHFPIPIVPGVTIPHGADQIQPKEVNDKAYQESQVQRSLERKIRAAKREVEMAGDLATKEQKARVKDAQAEMREFINKTGRTRRYDREQIGGTPKPRQSTPRKPAEPARPAFTPATSKEDAEKFASAFVDKDANFAAPGVSYDGVDLGVANRVNRTIWDLYNEFDVQKFGGVTAPKANTKMGKMIEGATAAYSPIQNSFFLNRKTLKTEKSAADALRKEQEAIKDIFAHPEKYDLSKSPFLKRMVEASRESGRASVPETIEEVLFHEFGHSLEKKLRKAENYQQILDRMPEYAGKVSGYATTDKGEYIAESFASWKKGENVADPLIIEAFISLRRAT